MKVVLVNPPYLRGTTRHAPLGICYIASVLEQSGFEVSIVDMESSDLSIQSTVDKITMRQPDIVGLSCMTPQYPTMLKVAEKVKEHKKSILTVFGGPHASALPHVIISNEYVDVCVRGEGEHVMLNLVRSLDEGRTDLGHIPGIVFKTQGLLKETTPPERIFNCDMVPLPARHLLNMNHYIFPFFDVKIPTTNIVASRGCPYGCRFCYKAIFGNVWRGRSPLNIVDEVRYLQREYDVEGIYFMDDNFCVNKMWIKTLCKKLRESAKVLWASGGIRVDLVSQELLEEMKESGCRWIGIGVESGDPQILQEIRKGVTVDAIIKAFKMCHSLGIFAFGFFMIGHPQETLESIAKTTQLIKVINPDGAYISIYTPYPGTEIYYEALRKGWLSDDFSWERLAYTHSNFTISQNFTISELKSLRDEMYLHVRR
jgi:anaerobic magnesium-protoporphyrin IX monomethyl ester cyclase